MRQVTATVPSSSSYCLSPPTSLRSAHRERVASDRHYHFLRFLLLDGQGCAVKCFKIEFSPSRMCSAAWHTSPFLDRLGTSFPPVQRGAMYTCLMITLTC